MTDQSKLTGRTFMLNAAELVQLMEQYQRDLFALASIAFRQGNLDALDRMATTEEALRRALNAVRRNTIEIHVKGVRRARKRR